MINKKNIGLFALLLLANTLNEASNKKETEAREAKAKAEAEAKAKAEAEAKEAEIASNKPFFGKRSTPPPKCWTVTSDSVKRYSLGSLTAWLRPVLNICAISMISPFY